VCVCVKREIMKTTVSKTNSQIKAVVLAVTGIYQHTAKVTFTFQSTQMGNLDALLTPTPT
jgi:hypothetical protein